MKKKKRFYNNKSRNKKWTETPQGRKISFADKYVTDEERNYKYDKKEKRYTKSLFTKDNMTKLGKGLLVFVCCVLILGVGYTLMDIHMELNSMPTGDDNNDVVVSLKDIDIIINGVDCQPLSLDGSVMQSAIVDEVSSKGYTSVVFDLKRNDGTIGYMSELATIQTYGAVSSPSGAIEKAVKLFSENDILPIGRINCYKDNIAPSADLTSALLDGGSLYKDSAGNTYLNPDSESAYNYIKSIVEESIGNGISVFLLDGCDLPSDVNDKYNTGFEALSEKLYKDFGDDVKFLKAVDVNFSSGSAKATQKEWQEKIDKKTLKDSNSVICITAKNINAVKNILKKNSPVNYIIFE